jgi:hypothetical protein
MKGKLLDAVSDALPDRSAIQLAYYRVFKKLPDLKSPKSLNEKLQWRKLYQRDARFITLSDKIAAKEEVTKLVGAEHVIENLWVGTNPEEIPWDHLETPYVVKTNHTSGCNWMVQRGEVVDRDSVTKELKKQLQFDHSLRWREWAYKGIKRGILIERMLGGSTSRVPADIKFLVYHGKARYVYVLQDRFQNRTIDFYDMDWNRLDCEFDGLPRSRNGMQRPTNLDDLVAIAEKIAAPFDFVRMDMYLEGGRIYFGEVTFYPGAGLGRLEPDEWDLRLGEPWKI